jgi:polysaccharide export outer membrane protein
LKQIFKLALLGLTVLGLLGPLTAGPVDDNQYRIGPKDLLTISVFNVPDLNTTVRVGENGEISLPLIGEVMVSGKTRTELEGHLVTQLEKKYLRNPQVTIFIKEYQSKMVSVIGAVKKPGNYEVVGKTTLLEVISQAEGLVSGEDPDRVVLIRKGADGQNESRVIDLNRLMMEGATELNVELKPGDIVNIPVAQHIDIYVFGQVKSPGHLRIRQRGKITLLQAIAQAGGFLDRARRGSVTITRREGEQEVKYKVNVKRIINGKETDFILQSNDIIHVSESVL